MKATSSYGNFRRVIAGIMALVMIVLVIPLTASPVLSANENGIDRVADPSTLNSWKNHFGANHPSTENVGEIWTDKSVFTSVPSEFPSAITMDADNNFLVSLSALGSNKEIKGYSTLPTDTMFVLDISGSMRNAGLVDDLVTAANSALKSLLSLNNHNRVGVVLYAAGSTVILPLGRYYTTNSDGNFIEQNNGSVRVRANVYNEATGTTVSQTSRSIGGGTYIQSGMLAARNQFIRDDIDPLIPEGEFQAGTTRTPVYILMSDGAPTYATPYYATYYNTTTQGTYLGNGNDEYDKGLAFITQLSNALAYNQAMTKYGKTPLFYTLGLGVDDNDYAVSVLDPVGSVATDYWASFIAPFGSNALDDYASGEANMRITVRGNNYTIQRRHPGIFVGYNGDTEIWTQDYVTEYYSASDAAGLISNFRKITDEIEVQSRYYPTQIGTGNDPNLDGYVRFTDKIGEYMEVKSIKGIVIGDNLYSGAMLTSKIAATDSDSGDEGGLGTVENPTDLGNEFVWSVQERLGISDLYTARALIADAWNTKQLWYDSATGEFSNYIGWFATAESTYAGHWYEGISPDKVPSNAKYIIRSYGFLGETHGSIQDSDMMYISVRVVTDIATGNQIVSFDIPAALVPLVTYEITVVNDAAGTATMNIVEEEPIRLVYETGLRSDINQYNVAELMASETEEHLVTDGDKKGYYRFYTNEWNVGTDSGVVTDDTATVVTYTPSTENEYYYFTEDVDLLYWNDGWNGQTPGYYRVYGVPEADLNTSYFYEKIIFKLTDATADGNAAVMETTYPRTNEQVVPSGVAEERYDYSAGSNYWYIPAGTPHHEADEAAPVDKSSNSTGTLGYSDATAVVHHNGTSVNLGNNGLLYIAPAQGIKLSKVIDVVEPGTDTSFDFTVTLTAPDGVTFESSYPAMIADYGSTEGTNTTVSVVNGVIRLTLNAGQTIYITDLPEGTTYVINELHEDNRDYKFDTVIVDDSTCVVDKDNATVSGTVDELSLDSIDYVNVAVSSGRLVISKDIAHPYGTDYEIPGDLSFTVQVELSGRRLFPADSVQYKAVSSSGSTVYLTPTEGNNGNHILTFSIKDDETVSIYDIPEGTSYTVTETNLPSGFELGRNSVGLSGTIPATANAYASLINTYSPASITAPVSIDVNKVLSGRDFKEGETFTFVLNKVGTAVEELDRVTATVVNGQLTVDGNPVTLSMASQTYTVVGQHDYNIVEIDDAASGNGILGMTYDKTANAFHVNVYDDMSGTLKAEVTVSSPATVSGNAESGWTVEANFNNTYKATTPAEVDVDITKVITSASGAAYPLNGFQFALYYADGTLYSDQNAVSDENGNATLELYFYTDDIGKTFDLVLKEINTEISVIDYDETEYSVKIEVIDNLDGTIGTKINGVATDSYSATFTNIYTPGAATATISGTKNLTGRELNAGEFSFILKDANGNEIQTVAVSKSDANNGSFVFDTLTFDTVGDYYYTVSEVKGGLGGVTYDETVYDVVITVSGTEGEALAASTAISVSGASKDSISFSNTYDAADSDPVVIEGHKTLNGRDLNADEFSFTLSGNGVNETVKNNADGSFKFSELTFDTVGDYYYTVSEVKGELGGVTYDENVYTVHVNVYDDKEGKLQTIVTYTDASNADADKAEFTNTYSANPTDEVVISGNKTLTGRDLGAGEFKFELVDSDGNVVETVSNASLAENGKFEFTALTFDTIDTYVYTVREAKGNLGGITYDGNEFTVTITVTDGLKGQLVADVQIENDAILFENSYAPGLVKVPLGGTKTLDGRDLKANEFSFNLSGEGVDETVKNGADGKFSFTDLEFTEPGTHTYTITEVVPDEKLGGVTYDTKSYTVDIIITDNLDGELVADVTYTSDGLEKLAVTFENSYAAAPTTATIEGFKTLNGRELDENEFEFVLKDSAGTVIESVFNKADGTFAFAEIEYTVAGTYVYTVSEFNNELGGVTYDDNVYTITVNVTDNGNGSLVASTTLADMGTVAPDNIEFINGYVAEETAPIVISGIKTLDGRDLKEGEFSFTLKDTDGNEIETVTNDAQGNFAFTALTFGTTGEFKYTVSEVKGELGGVTYDDAIYNITVTVTDDLDGKLVADVEIEGDSILFENSYSADSVRVPVSGNKKLTGRDLEAEEFSFILKDADGNEIETVQNDAEGNFEFSDLEFTAIGEYTYTITEVIPEEKLGGVTYDEREYVVNIEITDNGEGNLVYDVIYTLNGVEVELVGFENVYSAAPATAVIKGIKTLDGRELKEGEFEFLLSGADGTEIEKVSHDAQGNFAFSALTFDTVGEYKYTVKEVKGTLGGVTYDETVHEVVITVTDDLEGNLVATGAEVVISINNTYKAAPVSVGLNGEKILDGRDLKEGEFSFVLKDSDGAEIETVTNGADGKFSFEAIEYNTVGEWTYTVNEVKGELGGITYDETVCTAVVTVTDDKLGQLQAVVELTVEDLVFNNTYAYGSTTVQLAGNKTLTGRDLEEGEFDFILVETDESFVPLENGAYDIVTNDADGYIEFPSIYFDTEGTYYYQIAEIDDGEIGITYDTTIYNIVIDVADNLLGSLVATVTDENGNAVDIQFANSYEPVEITVPLEIIKTVKNLTEEDVGPEGFTFVLESEGNEIAKTVTDENGIAVFALTFTDADLGKTFTYKLSEVNDGMAGMTYSDETYEFVVEIVVDEDGELAANVTKNGSDENVLVAEFVNTYNGVPKTGDETNAIVWIAMLVISGGAVISMFKRSKKEQAI